MTITPRQITHAKPRWIGNEYPNANAFNADNTQLALVHGATGSYGLYSRDDAGTAALVRILTGVPASAELRWSRTDPKTFYFLVENRFYRWTDGVVTLLHTFSEYPENTATGRFGICGGGEGDFNFDTGDKVALANGDRTEVWIYTISTDTKSPVFRMPVGSWFDGLKISPSGNSVLVSEDGKPTLLYSAGQEPRQITPKNGHAAIGRDSNGDEILVWANAATKPIWPEDCTDAIVKIRLSDGETTCLLKITPPWTKASNISLGPGFALVSINGTEDGSELSNKILKVQLAGSGYEVLCPTNSRPTGVEEHDYNWQAKASLGRALPGKTAIPFVFCSNSGDVTTLDYCDVFLGEVPVVPANDLPPQPIVIDPPKPPVSDPRIEQLQGLLFSLQAENERVSKALALAEADRAIAASDLRQTQSDLAGCRHLLELSEAALSGLVPPDAKVWPRIDFLKPVSQLYRRWGFEVQPDGLLLMYDVWGTDWKPIEQQDGNQFLFVAIKNHLEMRQHQANRKPFDPA